MVHPTSRIKWTSPFVEGGECIVLCKDLHVFRLEIDIEAIILVHIYKNKFIFMGFRFVGQDREQGGP